MKPDLEKKCEKCNHFKEYAWGTMGYCRYRKCEIWKFSVGCREFDDTIIF